MKTKFYKQLNDREERANLGIWRTVLGFVGLVLLTLLLLYLNNLQ